MAGGVEFFFFFFGEIAWDRADAWRRPVTGCIVKFGRGFFIAPKQLWLCCGLFRQKFARISSPLQSGLVIPSADTHQGWVPCSAAFLCSCTSFFPTCLSGGRRLFRLWASTEYRDLFMSWTTRYNACIHKIINTRRLLARLRGSLQQHLQFLVLHNLMTPTAATIRGEATLDNLPP